MEKNIQIPFGLRKAMVIASVARTYPESYGHFSANILERSKGGVIEHHALVDAYTSIPSLKPSLEALIEIAIKDNALAPIENSTSYRALPNPAVDYYLDNEKEHRAFYSIEVDVSIIEAGDFSFNTIASISVKPLQSEGDDE